MTSWQNVGWVWIPSGDAQVKFTPPDNLIPPLRWNLVKDLRFECNLNVWYKTPNPQMKIHLHARDFFSLNEWSHSSFQIYYYFSDLEK